MNEYIKNKQILTNCNFGLDLTITPNKDLKFSTCIVGFYVLKRISISFSIRISEIYSEPNTVIAYLSQTLTFPKKIFEMQRNEMDDILNQF